VPKKKRNASTSEFTGIEHLLIAILNERDGASQRILSSFNITQERLYQALMEIRGTQRSDSPNAESKYEVLSKYSVDLTRLASEGKLETRHWARRRNHPRHPHPESAQQEQSGTRRREWCGQNGQLQKVSHSAFRSGDVPQTLLNKLVLSLDLGAMVAGSKFRGDSKSVSKASWTKFVPATAKSSSLSTNYTRWWEQEPRRAQIDASNMLKPALARGEMQVDRSHHA
jgi:ATP-dependent Clp protease ATP-binding subunit ClpC